MAAGTFSPFPNVESAVLRYDDDQRNADHEAAALRAVEAALTTLTTDATRPPTPTLLFRIALILRHEGYADQADKFFRQSSRMLSEQYVTQRLRLRRPRVA